VLAGDGAVVGCVWGNSWVPFHTLVNSLDGIHRMRGSKYVPSYVGQGYLDAINFVKRTGKMVLFSGTPCQIAAIQNIMDGDLQKKIVCCEVICHGVPSLKVFDLYLNSLFNGELITEFTFRSQKHGWISPFAVSESGKSYNVPVHMDAFVIGFVEHHLFLSKTCYNCPFQKIPRLADISLGDFWGIPKKLYDLKGISLVSVNTVKGYELINSLVRNGRIELILSDIRMAAPKTPRLVFGKWRMPAKRREFLNDLQKKMSFNQLIEKYYPNMLRRILERVINKIWRMSYLRSIGY
jgi:coenzyme F420-reducing hydrogenase beta subunit